MALSPGARFGPYTILGPLGRGGMASVYKCHEPALDRHIALKVLPREFLHDENFAERFRREAKVIARLEHPNIVPIHAFGIEDGVPWMAMRCITGGSLSGLLKNRRIDERRVLGVLRGVAEALDYAHSQGIVHRDVKPQNILLDDAGRVYLADFGIAKIAESSGGLTATGMITGHAPVHGARAGEGRRHRPSGRHLRPGRRGLRAPDRPDPLRRGHPGRGADEAPLRTRAPPFRARRARSRERRAPQVPGQGARGAMAVGKCVRGRPRMRSRARGGADAQAPGADRAATDPGHHASGRPPARAALVPRLLHQGRPRRGAGWSSELAVPSLSCSGSWESGSSTIHDGRTVPRSPPP